MHRAAVFLVCSVAVLSWNAPFVFAKTASVVSKPSSSIRKAKQTAVTAKKQPAKKVKLRQQELAVSLDDGAEWNPAPPLYQSPAAWRDDRYRAGARVKKLPRRIDGVLVSPAKANLWPVAVMIDNHPAARPQASLGQASVVYEALAEGGIPRFMAVFANRPDAWIGPVRSGRPYFLRYAAEYRAAFAHAGGSPDAQTLLHKLRLINLEGVRGNTAKYFFRGTRQYNNVHDLFTTGELLQKALQKTSARKNTPAFRSWKFTDDAAKAKRGESGHGIDILLGGGRSYDIRYTYDRSRNVYLRSTGGRPHLDRTTHQQIAVKNVVVLITPKERVLDRKGRIAINNLGSDVGVFLQNGRAMTIRWQKKTNDGRTILKTADGRQEISLVRGSTWFTVLPRGHGFRVF